MRKSSSVISLAAFLFGLSAAYANEPPKAKKEAPTAMGMPMPQKPGAETRALLPIAVDGKIKGKMPANAMAEGTPEMETSGKIDCEWTVDNLWLACEIKETMGTGKDAMKWSGQFMLGYDFMAKEYRATMVDNMGAASMMTGKLEGNKLILTSMFETMMDGKKCKGRFTYDWTNPKAIKLISENSTDGAPFKIIEEATLDVSKKETLPSPSA